MKLLAVKPFQETLNVGYCGPAILKMVLQYYGIDKSEKELAKLAKVDMKKVTSGTVYQIEPGEDGSVATIFALRDKSGTVLGRPGTFGWFSGACQ